MTTSEMSHIHKLVKPDSPLSTNRHQTQGRHYFWVNTGPCNWTRVVQKCCSTNCTDLPTKCIFYTYSL